MVHLASFDDATGTPLLATACGTQARFASAARARRSARPSSATGRTTGCCVCRCRSRARRPCAPRRWRTRRSRCPSFCGRWWTRRGTTGRCCMISSAPGRRRARPWPTAAGLECRRRSRPARCRAATLRHLARGHPRYRREDRYPPARRPGCRRDRRRCHPPRQAVAVRVQGHGEAARGGARALPSRAGTRPRQATDPTGRGGRDGTTALAGAVPARATGVRLQRPGARLDATGPSAAPDTALPRCAGGKADPPARNCQRRCRHRSETVWGYGGTPVSESWRSGTGRPGRSPAG